MIQDNKKTIKFLKPILWDTNITTKEALELLNNPLVEIRGLSIKDIHLKLLTSYSWYKLMDIFGKDYIIQSMLNEETIQKLYPKQLKSRYEYVKRTLKVEFINDVPFHFGDLKQTEIFSKVDNWRNILSNKISALSRLAAKDISDILFISEKYNFNWKEVIEEAKQKDIWVDEIAISDYIYNFEITKLESVNWIKEPTWDKLDFKLKQIAKAILLGNDN